MNLNMRTLTFSILTSGLLALGSGVAFAQSVNGIDNTTPGEAGHGTGCSNFVGGCHASEVSSAHGAYQPASDTGSTMNMSTSTSTNAGTTLNPDNTTAGESGHGTGFYTAPLSCEAASDATPGHCISGGTNK